MCIGEERVESRTDGEIHRKRIIRIVDIAAQIAQLGACAQRRITADILQRQLVGGAEVHSQRIGRNIRAFQVHVARHDAERPVVAHAARIAQVYGHVVVAVLAEILTPADLCEVDVVEAAESRYGIVIEIFLSVIGRRYLRRHARKDSHRRVVVDGVRARKGGHHHAAHADRLGVGAGERHLNSLGVCLECGQGRKQGYESFHNCKYSKKPDGCKKDASYVGRSAVTFASLGDRWRRDNSKRVAENPRGNPTGNKNVRQVCLDGRFYFQSMPYGIFSTTRLLSIVS